MPQRDVPYWRLQDWLRARPPIAIAVILILVAMSFAARVLLDPSSHPGLVMFVPAIVASAYIGGTALGLVALALTALIIDYAVLPPRYSWVLANSDDQFDLLFFVLSGIAIVAIVRISDNQVRRGLARQRQLAGSLSNLLKSAGIPTVFLDRQFNARIVSPAAATLFAISENDIGSPVMPAIQKFGDVALRSDADAVARNGVPIHREIRAGTGAAYYRDIRPYRTETGAADGVVVTYADISALKAAEAEAAAARRFAETIVDTLHDPLVTLDAEFMAVSANPSFKAAFARPGDDCVGRTLRQLDAAFLDAPDLAAALERARRRESVETLEWEPVDRGGQVFVVNVRPFRFGPRQDLLLLVAFKDITEQRRTIEEQFQSFLEASPDPMLTVGAGGRIRIVNAQVEGLFGYRRDELLGQPIDMLVPEAARERHADWRAAYLRSPMARQMGSGLEIEGMTANGHFVPLEISLSPAQTSIGPMVIAAIRDLTVGKAEARKLVAAKSAADRANQAKSRFLAAASHDLRQPLQTLQLLHSLLAKKVVDGEARAVLTKLEGVVAGMTDLLDVLLDVRQIEEGAIVANVTDFPVARLLDGVRGNFGPVAASKGLSLRVVRSSAIVRSDLRILRRILDNVVSNAIKYTESGRVLIGCRRSGSGLRIQVWDTGIGIPGADVQTVFDEFHQLEHRGRKGSGFGLGLYMVQLLAELLGHPIEVRSIPGKGSMFGFTVPLGDKAAATSGLGEDLSSDGAPAQILLVEDDDTQRQSLSALFDLEGYRCASASNGQEALALLAGDGFRPDLVVADYNLAGSLTGLDLVQRVRERLNASIPALIVTGDKTETTERRMKQYGVGLLHKPTRAAEIMARVRQLLGVGPEAAPAPVPPLVAGQSHDRAICVVDDDPDIRDSLALALGEEYRVTTYGSAEAFLGGADPSRFACIIVDIDLPGVDGLELQRRLKRAGVKVPLIFITAQHDMPTAVRAIRAGAADFLEKPVKLEKLLAGVAEAVQHDGNAKRVGSMQQELQAQLASLTRRERQVMDRIITGEPNKNIAADLAISLRTVEHHRQSVMRKMGVRSLADLVRMTAPIEDNP